MSIQSLSGTEMELLLMAIKDCSEAIVQDPTIDNAKHHAFGSWINEEELEVHVFITRRANEFLDPFTTEVTRTKKFNRE